MLFGQSEFRDQVNKRRNLADRVAGWIDLTALGPSDTRAARASSLARRGAGDLSMTFAADALDLIIEHRSERRAPAHARACDARRAALRGHPRALNVDAEVCDSQRCMHLRAAQPASSESEERIVAEPEKQRRWPWLAFRF